MEKLLQEAGVRGCGFVSPGEIVFSEEVRKICEGNLCGQYAKSWACPPAVGTVSQCRERCLGYERALVFYDVYALEDSFDHEGMLRGHRAFKELCDRVYERLKGTLPSFLLLSNEGCVRCKSCTYPHSPCRMEEKLFPSLEGFGIQVGSLAKSAGVPYNNGKDTVTYFGMLLYSEGGEDSAEKGRGQRGA